MWSSEGRASRLLWCCALVLAGALVAGPVVLVGADAEPDLRLVADASLRSDPELPTMDPVLRASAHRAGSAASATSPSTTTSTTTTSTTTTTSVPPALPDPPAPPPEPPPAPPPPPPPARLELASVPGGARLVDRLGSARSRELAASALAQIRYDWVTALPGWELRLLDGRTGYRGLTFPYERVVEVYLRAGDTPGVLAHVVAHELGHALDVELLDDGDRARWADARGVRPGTPWWVSSGVNDFASGSGDFAESFAWWQTSGAHWHSRLGPPPSPLQLGLLEELVVPR